MARKGPFVALLALVLIAGCDDFKGFSSRSTANALAGRIRIAALGDVMRPRFAAGGGNFLTFASIDPANNLSVFAVNAFTFESILISRPPAREDGSPEGFANDDSAAGAAVSGTFDAVAFLSTATNLDNTTPTTFERLHVYVRDGAGQNRLISQNADGFEANRDSHSVTMSSSGRFVVFSTDATNLVGQGLNGVTQLFLWDRDLEIMDLLTQRPSDGFAADGASRDPAISPDGRFVVFRTEASDLGPRDDNNEDDIYLFDRTRRDFFRITMDPLFDGWSPQVSDDGRIVTFSARSTTTPGRQVYAYDRATELMIPLSPGANGDSRAPAIGPRGRFIAFETDAQNLGGTPGPFTNIYVFDLVGSALTLVSAGLDGAPADGNSLAPTLSPNSDLIGFSTFATNLVTLTEGEEETSSADLIILVNPFLVEED